MDAITLKKKILNEYKSLFYCLLNDNKLNWTCEFRSDHMDSWYEYTSNEIDGIMFKFISNHSFSHTFYYGIDVIVDGNTLGSMNSFIMPFTRLKIKRKRRLELENQDANHKYLKLKGKINTLKNECGYR